MPVIYQTQIPKIESLCIMLGSKRAYGGPGRSYNTRSFKSRKTSSSDHAKLLRLQRTVAALKPEVKRLFTLVAITNLPSATGSISYISGIAQGVFNTERVGDSVRPIRLDVRFNMVGANAGTGFLYSLFIVKDKTSNGTVPSVAGTGGVLTSANSVTAFQNELTKSRFQILKRVDVSSNTYTFGTPGVHPFSSHSFKLSSPMNYQDTSGGQTGANTNALYLIVISNDGTDVADFSLQSELHFTDV